MAPRIRGVLFDLDDTLFDHAHATRRALAVLHASEPALSVWTPEQLERHHGDALETMHREVLAGRVSIEQAREERFRRLLAAAKGDETVAGRAATLARQYREQYERAWQPVPGARELLAALKAAGYSLGIVTNNLRAEQALKLRRCGLDAYVDVLVTSEEAGIAKPDPEIFRTALDQLRVSRHEAAMVGDAWDTDIVGAQGAGVRPIWFNWRRLPLRDAAVSELTSFAPAETALRVIVGHV